MRLYEIRHIEKTISFARSFAEARKVISMNDLQARKEHKELNPPGSLVTHFTNGYTIYAVDLKPDKENIIRELNNLIDQKPKSAPVVPSIPKIEDQEKYEDEILDYEQGITDEPPTLNGGSFSPPISYPGYPKNCKGTCVHCKKEVGWLLHVG